MAVNGKSYLIDTTKCTGCRACQVACKQWNELSAEPDVPQNQGSYENPPDRSENTWVVIRFKESERSDGTLAWTFLRESCRHCMDAPCRQVVVNKDSIVIDEATGAVIHTDAMTQEDFARISRICPFDIPRMNRSSLQLGKCVMCYDRVNNGMLPACAKACPTGAISFGDRSDILAMADARVAELREEYPQARVLDRRDVRLLLLVTEPAGAYAFARD